MFTQFYEVQDSACSNHGKFFVLKFGPKEMAYRSRIVGAPLLQGAVRTAKRFDGPWSPEHIILFDLQTWEGYGFNPTLGPEAIRRHFLMHPLHVCIAFYPFAQYLGRHHQALGKIPHLVTIPTHELVEQPGILLDRQGQPVRTLREWSARAPIAARLRNREVPIEEDGQDILTDDERVRGLTP